ncbi:nuclease-related domain-containing protein [Neobacillus jeddahensis]|uniref:nuclease-related domain-containing protein n=1 Tax=Neobacillus jeddahensis TaxID=1461580 RepID=UPI00058D8A2C|nr:nuclease-related domain-containing protein [Neobacillus jeddahensis]
MSFFKDRKEPSEAAILRILDKRMQLAEKDKQYYHNLVKGFEGEVMFDSLTEKLQCESLFLNDLLLDQNNSTFQLDSVMITQDPLYLFEVKNYEGDFYYEDGRFYTLSKKEIKNPLHQLARSESLLRQLLQSIGYRIPIKSYVIFINPQFTLYQAPINQPIIFPNQLPNFMGNLNERPSKLTRRHKSIAEKLVSLHQNESLYKKLPPYNYESLRKGLNCSVCYSFMVFVEDKKLVCDLCGHQESVDTAILRAVEELKLLFPGEKITTNGVHEWCQVVDSKKTIRRVLKQNYSSIGKREFHFIKLE